MNKKKPSEVSAPDVSDTLFPVGSMKNSDIHVTKLPRRTVRLEITEEPGMCESQDPLYEAGSSFFLGSLVDLICFSQDPRGAGIPSTV